MTSLLRRVDEELSVRINCPRDYPNKYEFITLISSLSAEEKCFIAKKFCEYEWNIGSVRVLSILQDSQVLSATEYILRQDDDKHIKLVFYDFLETEYNLLANLIENFHFSPKNSVKLKLYLEDCFQQLIRDAIENPNIVNIQYLSELRKVLSEKAHLKIISMHLYALLKLESETVTNCFVNSKVWVESIRKNVILLKLLEELTKNQKFVLDELFKISSTTNFKGWKYFLVLLGIISDNSTSDSALTIKKYLKDLFKSFISKCDKEICYLMFAVARTVYATKNLPNSPNTETYSSWFKNTIGNMRYTIDAQCFRYAISVLEEMIQMEDDPTFIQVRIVKI